MAQLPQYHQAHAGFEALTMREAGLITREEESNHTTLLWCIANPNGPDYSERDALAYA